MSHLFGGRSRNFGRLVGTLLFVALGTLCSACGLENDVSSAATGPLLALKDSDTVVETNLTTVLTAVQSGEPASQGGIATTSGPSTSYGLISVSGSAGQPIVLAGFNQLSDDCLGLVYFGASTPSGTSVLGQTQGTAYFWVLRTTASDCDAASFAATPSAPKSWPSGDPSSSGFPLP
ncbi:MAG: hypothetical protein WAL04_16060 [Acidimicrobiales bacterium]|jgi:hypothetical protein